MDDIKTGRSVTLSAALPVRYQIPGSPVTIAIVPAGASLSGYQIIEPEIRADQFAILDSLRDHMLRLFRDKSRYREFSKNFSRAFSRMVAEYFPLLESDEVKNLEYYIHRDARGFGPLQPLVDDPAVTMISIHGPGRIITVQHLTYGILFTSISPNEEEIFNLLRKICNRSVTPVDIGNIPPEISLRSGLRVHLSAINDGSIPSICTIEKPPSSKQLTSQN